MTARAVETVAGPRAAASAGGGVGALPGTIFAGAACLPGTVAASLAVVELDGAAAAALGVPAGGLALRRSWPRGPGRLTAELCAADGSLVAAQWLADAAALAHAHERTARHGPAVRVAVAHGGRAADGGPAAPLTVLLQAHGADRRLPALRDVLAEPGAELLVHRAERRAVARAGGTYAKVVRPGRAETVAAAARAAAALAAPLGFAVAEPVSVDAGRGVVRFAPLPGRALHERLAGDRPGPAAAACGAAVAALHAVRPPAGVPVHDAAAEVAVLERWTGELAAHAGAGSPADAAARRAREALPRVAAALLDGPAGPLVAVHRDLHDKQLLVGDDGAVGLLDFDTLAAGEAALDVANLLVHLELRALQDACAPAVARAAANALLDAYAPGDALRARVRAYAQATRLRLACLYAFRPGPPGLVGELLSRLTPVPAAPRRAAGSRPAAPTR